MESALIKEKLMKVLSEFEKIVEKWVDYFVYHKDIKFERINKKIK